MQIFASRGEATVRERRKILLYLDGKSGLIDGFCIKLLHSTQSVKEAGKRERGAVAIDPLGATCIFESLASKLIITMSR